MNTKCILYPKPQTQIPNPKHPLLFFKKFLVADFWILIFLPPFIASNSSCKEFLNNIGLTNWTVNIKWRDPWNDNRFLSTRSSTSATICLQVHVAKELSIRLCGCVNITALYGLVTNSAWKVLCSSEIFSYCFRLPYSTKVNANRKDAKIIQEKDTCEGTC